MLVNLATAHVGVISAALGPCHETAYLAAIALTWFPGSPTRARLLAITPGIGGLLAHRATGRH